MESEFVHFHTTSSLGLPRRNEKRQTGNLVRQGQIPLENKQDYPPA